MSDTNPRAVIGGNNPPPLKAYHGTPYDFEQFLKEKIGTGEGAQAYGHGLYFAENRGIAQHYRDAVTNKNITQGNPRWTVDGVPIREIGAYLDDLRPHAGRMDSAFDEKNAFERYKERHGDNYSPEMLEMHQKWLNQYQDEAIEGAKKADAKHPEAAKALGGYETLLKDGMRSFDPIYYGLQFIHWNPNHHLGAAIDHAKERTYDSMQPAGQNVDSAVENSLKYNTFNKTEEYYRHHYTKKDEALNRFLNEIVPKIDDGRGKNPMGTINGVDLHEWMGHVDNAHKSEFSKSHAKDMADDIFQDMDYTPAHAQALHGVLYTAQQGNMTVPDAYAHSLDYNLSSPHPEDQKLGQTLKEILPAIANHVKPTDNSGRLYEVGLHVGDHDVLDWDEQFQDHHPAVVEAVRGLASDGAPVEEDEEDDPWMDAHGTKTGQRIYQKLSDELGGPAKASEALLNAGVRGIRYRDAGSRKPDKKLFIDGQEYDKDDGFHSMLKGAWDEAGGVRATPKAVADLLDEKVESAKKKMDAGKSMHGYEVWKYVRDRYKEEKPKLELKQPRGTYNYVIFDPQFVQIMKKFDRNNQLIADYGVHLKQVDHDPFAEDEK